MPRLRTWPLLAEPSLEGFVAYKVGMTHVGMIDDSDSPAKGTEVVKPVTLLEIPRTYVYGIRFYSTKKHYEEPAKDVYVRELAQKLGIKKTENSIDKLSQLKQHIAAFVDVTALAYSDPSNLGFGNKRLMRFEINVGGKTPSNKLAFIEQWLGKEIKLGSMLNDGDYVDVKSISKGKGWAGVIKRFGVARLPRKATQKVRHVGTLGPWHPPKVLFTVPQAGHMGYNYRTELNKRVLKVGAPSEANTVNVSGGYLNYGLIKNEFMIVEGSIPGPSKRLVRIRKAIRNRKQTKKPQITYISISSKQGA